MHVQNTSLLTVIQLLLTLFDEESPKYEAFAKIQAMLLSLFSLLMRVQL